MEIGGWKLGVFGWLFALLALLVAASCIVAITAGDTAPLVAALNDIECLMLALLVGSAAGVRPL